MTQPQTDPGHLVPQSDWERIVGEAESHAPSGTSAARLARGSFPSVTDFIQAKYDGGPQPGGKPTFGVLHDAETPLAAGYALAISNYFTRNINETSAHFMLGPDATYQLVDTGLVAWHCGNGNQRSIGVEQAGYAAFTRDQWLTADGVTQMTRLAQLMREIQAAHGIGLYFMTDDQLRAAWDGQIVGGWATHDQCRRVLGGTTHTDPVPNYPFDQLEAVLGGTPAPQPAPTPAPAPSPPPRLAWPFGRGQYVGDINGPAACHGGFYAGERPFIQNVQQWLIYHGCVPGQTDWRSGWADGRFQAPYSTDAAARWHARFYAGQPFPTQIWADDYDRLARP